MANNKSKNQTLQSLIILLCDDLQAAIKQNWESKLNNEQSIPQRGLKSTRFHS